VDERDGGGVMSDDIQAIAARIREAEGKGYLSGRTNLHSLLVDEVALTRVPPMPGDGMRNKAKFLEMWQSENGAFERALTNYRQEDVDVSVDGNLITVVRSLCGTAPDGSDIHASMTNILTIENGRVVAMEVHVGDASLERLREVIVASGLPHADFTPSAPQ
jgi:hypothetical protein